MEVATMRKTLTVLLLTSLLAAGTAMADTLIIEGIDQAKASAASRPSRGMTMNAVSSRWGAPTAKLDPVGQPPITRWEYADFVVYFEHDYVIDSVVRRP
jgi:hypothetical protein